MLKPSEVWRRAWYEGLECPLRGENAKRPSPISYRGLYRKTVDHPRCAIGLLVQPYQEQLDRDHKGYYAPVGEVRKPLADLYGVTLDWLAKMESHYEYTPGTTLLTLAEMADKEGH